jgi:hypothetical protein
MELLNPAALFGLLALPLLLLPYLIRRKPQRAIFSSLLLLVAVTEKPSRRPWGKIHLPWIFFLQLLLLTLLIIALSEPVLTVRPSQIAIVLDNSASMQTLEDGRSRFAIAQEKARAVIAEMALTGQIDLYLTAPRIEKVGTTPFAPSDAVKAVAALKPYDLGEPPVDYGQVLMQLAQSHKYERVYLFTDHPARGQSAVVRVINVGQPQANFALTGFEVQRSSLTGTRLNATVEATNYSARDEKIRILIKGNTDQTIASRELSIAAGKSAAATFDGVAEQPYYVAEIATADRLALDNRRFAAAPASRSLRILGVSPRPKELASLKTIPGVQIDLIAPSEYETAQRAGYGLEIFHFAAPGALPRAPALFILPPQSSSLVDLTAPSGNTTVSNWREPHGLTRYINFSLFRPAYARALKPQTAGEIIIEGSSGPLAFAVEHQGVRYLTLGFDPFPFLGRENLPMSIFTLNMLDWFVASAAGNQATGEPIALGTVQPGDLMITPSGENLALQSGYDHYSGTFYQGIYQRMRGRQREISARNLDSAGESDLRAATLVELRGGTVDSAPSSALVFFWPYLLIASLLLLLIEWFAQPRMAGLRQWFKRLGFGFPR